MNGNFTNDNCNSEDIVTVTSSYTAPNPTLRFTRSTSSNSLFMSLYTIASSGVHIVFDLTDLTELRDICIPGLKVSQLYLVLKSGFQGNFCKKRTKIFSNITTLKFTKFNLKLNQQE